MSPGGHSLVNTCSAARPPASPRPARAIFPDRGGGHVLAWVPCFPDCCDRLAYPLAYPLPGWLMPCRLTAHLPPSMTNTFWGSLIAALSAALAPKCTETVGSLKRESQIGAPARSPKGLDCRWAVGVRRAGVPLYLDGLGQLTGLLEKARGPHLPDTERRRGYPGTCPGDVKQGWGVVSGHLALDVFFLSTVTRRLREERCHRP